nr:hypothetical protein [Escherichia coli]
MSVARVAAGGGVAVLAALAAAARQAEQADRALLRSLILTGGRLPPQRQNCGKWPG